MLEAELAQYLMAGEKVLWKGRPVQGVILTREDFFIVPFMLFWCSFFISDLKEVLTGPDLLSGKFFMLLPFVAAGLYGLIIRFFVDAWDRRRLYYAVTNQRILIVRQAPFAKFLTISLSGLPEMSFQQRASGKGTIIFGESGWRWRNDENSNFSSPPRFVGIDQVATVFKLIQSGASQLASQPRSDFRKS